jgi:hypothetical protein
MSRGAGVIAPHRLHPRVGGKIVVRRSEFDQWMQQFRRQGDAGVEQVVNEVLRDIKRA